MSHMYNTGTDFGFQAANPCPASHPVRVPQVAYEALWDTAQFNSMWPSGASNPFVMSYNDAVGYGTHADYVFGWKGDSLQRAMDSNCMFNGCENGNPLKSQSVQQMNACQVKDMVNEDINNCKFLFINFQECVTNDAFAQGSLASLECDRVDTSSRLSLNGQRVHSNPF